MSANEENPAMFGTADKMTENSGQEYLHKTILDLEDLGDDVETHKKRKYEDPPSEKCKKRVKFMPDLDAEDEQIYTDTDEDLDEDLGDLPLLPDEDCFDFESIQKAQATQETDKTCRPTLYENRPKPGHENTDQFFMEQAMAISEHSKDPHTKVGAVIVDPAKNIIGSGYNRMPQGSKDGDFPWAKGTEDPLDSKHAYVVHAEINALANAAKNRLVVKGCTVYVTLFPCNKCAQSLTANGIKEVVYKSTKDKWEYEASRRILNKTRVKYRKFTEA